MKLNGLIGTKYYGLQRMEKSLLFREDFIKVTFQGGERAQEYVG
jgi:hypothetical protein